MIGASKSSWLGAEELKVILSRVDVFYISAVGLVVYCCLKELEDVQLKILRVGRIVKGWLIEGFGENFVVEGSTS
jgi:hypothetical protein